MEGAMTATEVSNALGLSALKTRTWSIFKTSATKGEGLEEAMDWYGAARRKKSIFRDVDVNVQVHFLPQL